MKKALVALLILAVAGGVFAQEVKFTGAVNTGFDVTKGDDDYAGDEGLTAWAHDAGVANHRFTLNGAYVNGDVGFDFRLRAEKATGGQSPFVRYAYGWANIFDGLAKIKAGSINDAAWETKGDYGDDAGEGVGFLAQVTAVENLNAGAGVYWAAWNNELTSLTLGDTTTSHTEDHPILTVGLAYDLPDTFGLRTSWKLDEFVNDDGEVKYGLTSGLIGVSILAIPNLTAELEFVYANSIYWDPSVAADFGPTSGSATYFNDPAFTFVETLGYKISDAIEVGLIAYEYMTSADIDDKTLSFTVTPWATYTFGNFVPKIAATYGRSVLPAVHGDYADWTPLYVKDSYSALEINPSVLWNVAPKASIDIGFAYDLVFEDYDGSDLDNNFYKFYADFIWSF